MFKLAQESVPILYGGTIPPPMHFFSHPTLLSPQSTEGKVQEKEGRKEGDYQPEKRRKRIR